MKKPARNYVLTAVFTALALISAGAANSYACACCAEPGTYINWTGRIEPFQVELLGEMKFERSAELYMTEAGFDGIRGLAEIQEEYEALPPAEDTGFDLTAGFARRSWTFTFKTPGGRTGRITLPMPVSFSMLKADIHDGRNSDGGGPLLYKQFVFKGRAGMGTGFLRRSLARPANYELVLQGRGNGCDNAYDFSNWRLEVTGPSAAYAFYGKLSPGGGPAERPAAD